jgi:hypothetical protein
MFLSSRTLMISRPTKPVAPTIASFIEEVFTKIRENQVPMYHLFIFGRLTGLNNEPK